MIALKNNYIFPAIFILMLCVNYSFAQHQPAHKKTKKHKATHHPADHSTEPHHPGQHELHNVGSDYKQHDQHQNDNGQHQQAGYVSLSSTPKELVPGLNLKFSPAFFWKTIGAELEYVPSTHFSLGLNVYGKWGVTKPEKTESNNKYNFFQNGLRAALAFKYYIFNKAPEGLYVQANVAYTQLNYYNGSPLPYTLYNIGLSSNEAGLTPKPYSGGLGVGYQVIILPNVIIGNVMAGVQANVAGDNKMFMSLYIAPSIGIIF